MASCAGSSSLSYSTPLDQEVIDRLALDLVKCVRKDHLVKAKFILKGLPKEDKRKIASKTFEGNAPLFIATQQGQVHFVNYMLDECTADIEQRGVYEVQEDRSRHQVTPLWCAAVANKLEVVKTLIKHGADVNATSDTQSTPVRSACYMTNIDVVRYLVEYGADIHKPNMNGGTCLINSVQSVDLCRFLIDKGASVNSQDNSGNLALHYAIREGRMETVKLLLMHGSDPYVRNDFGDDAIQTASIRGYTEILDYLLRKIRPKKEREIEAYELMATNYVDEKHDLQRAIQIWRDAMEMRYQDPGNVFNKPEGLKSNHAYQHAKEAQSIKDLEDIIVNPDLVYMQALLIRERILGPDHKDTIFGLMYRGAVYADTHRYQRCVDLWRYAFTLRHEKQEALNHECLFTLQALCKLFWEIHEEHTGGFTNENVAFDDVIAVFKMSVREVELAQATSGVQKGEAAPQLEDIHTILLLVLHLIHLLSVLDKSEEEGHMFRCFVHRLVKLHPRGTKARSLLHLAVLKQNSHVNDELYSDFPSADVVAVLLECGTDVNAVDDDRNTPLHGCMADLTNLDAASNDSNDVKISKEYSKVAGILIDNGAHIDAMNKSGLPAGRDINKPDFTFRTFDHVNLKCLTARVIKKQNIPYLDEVPLSLVEFIEMH